MNADSLHQNETAAGTAQAVEPPLPGHLIALPGDQWAVWRWVGLRGAGFPARQVDLLVASGCAEVADQVIETADQLTQARREALGALHSEIERAEGEQRAVLGRALWRIGKGKPPQNIEALGAAGKLAAEFVTAKTRHDQARAGFDQQFSTGREALTAAIIGVVRDNRFREAVIWQNRHAYETGIAALLRSLREGTARNSHWRQHEEVVAKYLQRYCTKNDTIGFFGPVGWARFAPAGELINVSTGPSLLAERNIYFEDWGVELLAASIARDKALRPWLAPRRHPAIYIEQHQLYLPFKPPLSVTPDHIAILRACDGTASARDLAARLVQDPTNDLRDEADIFSFLEYLNELQLITWTLEVPGAERPERALRRTIERIADTNLRTSTIEALDTLEAARTAVRRAAGDAEQLNQALADVETTFTRLTGQPATRSAGTTYGARTLVYEDCRRDIEVTLGPGLLEALGPPLSLILTSGRWFTFEVAAAYRALFQRLYTRLAAEIGSPTVPLINLWHLYQPLFLSGQATPDHPVRVVERQLQERWGQILALPAGERKVVYSAEQLRPHVLQTFAAPHPGWHSARYQSPDIMIAAPSLDALRRGEYQLVLGELHAGSNLLRGQLFVAQHPTPEELLQATESDLPMPRVVPVPPRQWPWVNARTRDTLALPRDFRLVFADRPGDHPQERILPIGSLVIEQDGQGLVVRPRDRSARFDIIEFFSELLAFEIVRNFKYIPPQRHSPRIMIDRLVIGRESWSFTPDELSFANEMAEAPRYLAVRRWARAQDLPRQVFVRTASERKPLYLDFDSPVLVNIFAKAIRRSAEALPGAPIVVSEMLPALDQLWLADRQGQLYAGELRIVAVDPAVESYAPK